jgi:ferrous iron transport protein B
MRPGVIPLDTVANGFVALVGSPNSGKTTLFNWLTGSKFKTVNYPGATVDYSIGQTHERLGEQISVMDTPGTYSLEPKSPDERVTLEAIFAHKHFGAAKVVVAIADGTQLARQLLLTRQLLEAGFRVILAVTMGDLLRERGESLDTTRLSLQLGIPVVLIDGRLGGGIKDLAEVMRSELTLARLTNSPEPKRLNWSSEKLDSVFNESFILAESVIEKEKIDVSVKESKRKRTSAVKRTRQIDHWLLHPVWGLVIFFLLMSTLFSCIFWLAKPIMDLVDKGFSFVGDHALAIDPHNLGLQFLSGGVIASISSVLVFVPQIFILFVGIILLEDSGYLARSATLIDKPLSKLGLGGRSFVPLLSGYACAVPAMMAARTINSRRERWLTLLIIPLMSCSARLPVYALLLSFLYYKQAAWKAGLTLSLIYFASLLCGAIASIVVGHFLKIEDRSFFMMELPVYRRPHLKNVFRQAVTRTQSYVKRAGPAIFTFALIIWLATTFPNARAEDKSERLQSSYAAQAGRLIEPVFKPMGGDWRVGVGLMSAFAAREVFVSSLAVVFQVADSDEETMSQTLLQKMHDAKAPDGLPLFTLASVLGLIIFFMIALQCLSTVMVAVRESGGWRFAIGQLIAFNIVAYILAVGLVQGLRACGIA